MKSARLTRTLVKPRLLIAVRGRGGVVVLVRKAEVGLDPREVDRAGDVGDQVELDVGGQAHVGLQHVVDARRLQLGDGQVPVGPRARARIDQVERQLAGDEAAQAAAGLRHRRCPWR